MTKAYQVFVGCPFLKAIRKNYDKLKADLERETPLHVVLADTTAISSTDYLLENITTLIRESAGCIFDATGGNPNVSLEVGIAHALPADFLIALYTSTILSRYLDRLPYMRRWAEFSRRNRSFVSHAMQVFAEVRASGRTVRPRVISMLDGTGVDADDLLRLLSEANLLTVKRGRAGGIYYQWK